MCGLAGILHLEGDGIVTRRELEPMVAALAPRGPDGTGYYTEPGIGLGHARLSIIDLAGGDQPIHNEDQTVWTVFNGEIFNYVELRAELETRGHCFYTQTDTEVIVHAYEEYGDDFPSHLNGQFAIALWDAPRRRLLLVRDRPGILPLYFTHDPGRLLFASEVKALLPAMRRRPALDPAALNQLMTFWAPVSPASLFQGVEEVSPGEMVVVENGRLRRQRYWEWTFPGDGEYLRGSAEELAEELHELLLDATRLRLRADVPVGAYLSGGLDSSGIAGLVKHSGHPHLRTFSIRFEDPGVDETEHQERMIRHLGTDHTSILCRNADIADIFPRVIARTEAPVLRTAPAPMSILSGLVRQQGYKVVLTGEGADEVLGGYDLFKEAKIRQFWARQPDSKWRPALLKKLYPYLDLNQRSGSAYLKQFFGQGLDDPEAMGFSHLPRWSTTGKTRDFFSPEFRATITDDPEATLAARLPAGFSRWHSFNRAQFLEARTLMAGYLLNSQGDRMLMANSVEGRFPFLDHRIIEFANRLHPTMKMRGLNEKYLLKKALTRHLPRETVARYKQPYRAPDIAAFFGAGGPPDYVRECLSPESLQATGYFDAQRVQHLLKKIEHGRVIGFKDNMAFLGVLSTQLWHRTFVEERPAQVTS
ncbi:asparagine synthase (glutamine-hydrolyzing) [Thioalkalivibrio sp. XN8]|uniref:asparagine synthase (glutamine-hydrolyzing) n=1 Tax=Thioalkalivibrio sp. XN8 TaxID=2712863 RepID=UPI0013ECFB6A|nr:asparagine synthase (glutamine-hydrolyzing) [Thioalkalivibrio sp. XN8]NGP53681.1 asparagine synthase (glutamine-hydrolyzing) [Thioalkalivibrio sp. XN8]